MGQVCYVSASAKYLAIELNTCIKNDKRRCTQRYEAKDEDPCKRIKYGEHKQYPVDGSRSSNKDDVCPSQKIADKTYDTTEQSGQQIKEEELLTSDTLFNHGPKQIETYHIEQKMGEAPMDKHIGEGLPNIPMQDKGRNHSQIVGTIGVDHTGYKVYQGVDDHQLEGHIRIGVILKSPVEDIFLVHAHKI